MDYCLIGGWVEALRRSLRNSKFLLSDNVRIADSSSLDGCFSSFDLNRSVRGSPPSRSFNPREKAKIKSIPDVTGSSEEATDCILILWHHRNINLQCTGSKMPYWSAGTIKKNFAHNVLNSNSPVWWKDLLCCQAPLQFFFFTSCLKNFYWKVRFLKLSCWKYTFMAMFIINCVFLLLQPYLTIFKDALLRLF